MTPETPTRRHALATLRHRDFGLLWSGQIVSATGQMMQFTAVTWQVFVLTDSPFQVGLLGLFRAVPYIVLSLAGGVTADLVNRKLILLASQLSLLLISLLLAFSTALDATTVWLIYLLTFVSGAAGTFEGPARQALIPTLVPRGELANALTLNAILRQGSSIVGPGIGGVAIGQLGLAPTYGLTLATFLVAIASVLLMRPTPTIRQAGAGGWEAVLGGLRYARREAIILSVLALDFTVSVFVSIGTSRTFTPMLARDVMGVGPEGLGLLFAAPAVGAVVGATVFGALGGVRRQLPVMLAASTCQALLFVAFGFSPYFGLSLAILFGMGVANVIAEVLRSTIVQLRTPDELQGRVMALVMIFSWSGPHVGQVQSGAVAALGGPTSAALLGGLGALLAIASLSRLPAMKRGLAEVASA